MQQREQTFLDNPDTGMVVLTCCNTVLRMQGAGGGCKSQASSTGSSSANSSSSSMAAIEQQLGVSPQELMQRLMSRPDLLAKVQDPEVGRSDMHFHALRLLLCINSTTMPVFSWLVHSIAGGAKYRARMCIKQLWQVYAFDKSVLHPRLCPSVPLPFLVTYLLKAVCRVSAVQVQKALMEISQSPWKLMKYMFNKKVMSALKVRGGRMHLLTQQSLTHQYYFVTAIILTATDLWQRTTACV